MPTKKDQFIQTSLYTEYRGNRKLMQAHSVNRNIRQVLYIMALADPDEYRIQPVGTAIPMLTDIPVDSQGQPVEFSPVNSLVYPAVYLRCARFDLYKHQTFACRIACHEIDFPVAAVPMPVDNPVFPRY